MFWQCIEIPFDMQVRRTKRLLSISPAHLRALCALSRQKNCLPESLCTKLLVIIFNIQKFFVMAEGFSAKVSAKLSQERERLISSLSDLEDLVYLGRSMGRHRRFVRSTLCELLRIIVVFLF